ncbi:hypothetical protein Bca101_032962 [Brassica carinata]
MLLSNPIEAFHPLYTCYEKCKLGSSSSSSFDLLIRHYVRSRKGLDGVLVFRMMKEVSLVPQVRTLSALLHGLVHCRHYGLVMGVFEEMINVGVRPDLYIYSGVILDRVSIGHGGRADELVFEAVVQIPDSPLFNQGVVLRKLNTTHAQRRGRRAIEVLKKLVRRRLLYHSYSMQVHGYISNSLRDDPYSFTLVHGCHGSFSIRHWLQQSDWLPTLEATLALDEESLKDKETRFHIRSKLLTGQRQSCLKDFTHNSVLSELEANTVRSTPCCNVPPLMRSTKSIALEFSDSSSRVPTLDKRESESSCWFKDGPIRFCCSYQCANDVESYLDMVSGCASGLLTEMRKDGHYYAVK